MGKKHAAHAAPKKAATKTAQASGTKRKHPLRNGLITLFVVLAVVAGVSGIGSEPSDRVGDATAGNPAVAASSAAEGQQTRAGGTATDTDSALQPVSATVSSTATPPASGAGASAPGGAAATAGESAIPSAATLPGDDFLARVDSFAVENPTADTGDYVELDGNVPSFTPEDATTEAFQSYAELDALGRCGTAYACLGPETLPTQERGDISEVHPSGWQSVSYDFVDGGSLYNRSHLIAFCLTGQNANERNLITGTRHMNADVMAPIEEMVLDYIEQTGNHVLYRVTPVFSGNELVVRGVQIEALSMEDGGQGVSLNLYLRNTQPGVAIDYATGNNWADGTLGAPDAQPAETQAPVPVAEEQPPADGTEPVPTAEPAPEPAPVEQPTVEPMTSSYVVNTNTGKFHYPSCSSADQIKPENRWDVETTRDNLIAQGYVPCKRCNP